MGSLRRVGLLSIVLLAGCAPVPVATGQQLGIVSEYSLGNDSLFDQPGYVVPAGAVLATVTLAHQDRAMRLSVELSQGGFSSDVTSLRNPGVAALVVKSHIGKMLTSAERVRIQKLASGHGMKLERSGKVPLRYGPDGKTPMLMRCTSAYAVVHFDKIGPLKARLTFPDAESARSAARYVDSWFGLKVDGKALELTYPAISGYGPSELAVLKPLAQRFGGTVDWVRG